MGISIFYKCPDICRSASLIFSSTAKSGLASMDSAALLDSEAEYPSAMRADATSSRSVGLTVGASPSGIMPQI